MNYSPLRISTLTPDKEIPFSLYIFFKEQYLEYLKAGGSITEEKYLKLKKQKISKFYIVDEDEYKYQLYLDDVLQSTLDDDSIAIEDKAQLVEGACETALDKMHDDPGSEESFNMTKKAAKNLRRLVFENPEALKMVFGGDSESEPLIKHSLNVCALSMKFAKKLKCSEDEIDNLSTASLMHDVGIVKLPAQHQALFQKSKAEFTPQEKLGYFEHCKGFIKLIADKPYINGQIISLIENHEENRSGTGPYKKIKLEKTEEILSLVNTYDKKVGVGGMTPDAAIKSMMIDELGNYDLDIIQKFQVFLKEEKIIS